eukprot:917158-Heterocapsa_arctica.AAC.1
MTLPGTADAIAVATAQAPSQVRPQAAAQCVRTVGVVPARPPGNVMPLSCRAHGASAIRVGYFEAGRLESGQERQSPREGRRLQTHARSTHVH